MKCLLRENQTAERGEDTEIDCLRNMAKGHSWGISDPYRGAISFNEVLLTLLIYVSLSLCSLDWTHVSLIPVSNAVTVQVLID